MLILFYIFQYSVQSLVCLGLGWNPSDLNFFSGKYFILTGRKSSVILSKVGWKYLHSDYCYYYCTKYFLINCNYTTILTKTKTFITLTPYKENMTTFFQPQKYITFCNNFYFYFYYLLAPLHITIYTTQI